MRKSKQTENSLLTKLRLAVAGFAGVGTLVTGGLVAFNGAAHSAVLGASADATQNTVAIVLISALFCVTAALSWAFMIHLADTSTPNGTKPRKR